MHTEPQAQSASVEATKDEVRPPGEVAFLHYRSIFGAAENWDDLSLVKKVHWAWCEARIVETFVPRDDVTHTEDWRESTDELRERYGAMYAAVPEPARQFAAETWGEMWAHAEMGSLVEFAALASHPGPDAGNGSSRAGMAGERSVEGASQATGLLGQAPSHQKIYDKLDNDSLDAIIECIGSPRLYNDGKSQMRQWFLSRLRRLWDLPEPPIA